MIIKAPNKKLETVCRCCLWSEAKTIHKLLLDEVRLATKDQKKHGYVVVGLAAPQIGKTVTAFTAFGHVFINPHITWHSDDTIASKEGCLSLPDDKIYDTTRYNHIHLEWFTKSRGYNKSSFKDAAAVIVQHELDHLQGVLLK